MVRSICMGELAKRASSVGLGPTRVAACIGICMYQEPRQRLAFEDTDQRWIRTGRHE